MIQKLKLGSTLAALFLFLMPWVDIQCSQKSMVTQTGLQVIYGGGSVSDDIEAMGGNSKKSNSNDSMGFAPLVALALICVVAACVFGCLAFFKDDQRADMISMVLPAIALTLLLIQLMIGFPAKKEIFKSMNKDNPQSEKSGSEFDGLGDSMAKAMMMNISVETKTAFYIELFALGFPTLILINGFIDKQKKANRVGGRF